MFPGPLTKAEQDEYTRLSRHIAQFVAYCEETREKNKKAKPEDRQEIDYNKNLSDEGYFRWDALRTKGWS